MAGRPKKVTWDAIYKDFKARYPRTKAKIGGFEPFGFAEILLLGLDGKKYVYNYDTKMVKNMWSEGGL